MSDAEPSEDAVRLMHRLRTYGETTSFAITDRAAALQIDLFAAKRSEPLREAVLAELGRCARRVARTRASIDRIRALLGETELSR